MKPKPPIKFKVTRTPNRYSVTIGGKEFSITEDEARSLHKQLDAEFRVPNPLPVCGIPPVYSPPKFDSPASDSIRLLSGS